jgi:hypothetical protein
LICGSAATVTLLAPRLPFKYGISSIGPYNREQIIQKSKSTHMEDDLWEKTRRVDMKTANHLTMSLQQIHRIAYESWDDGTVYRALDTLLAGAFRARWEMEAHVYVDYDYGIWPVDLKKRLACSHLDLDQTQSRW